jgi:hypothetical protein
MIRGRCPICSKSYEIAAPADLPTFPFCSSRCRLIDLGRWIEGTYVVPDSKAPDPTGSNLPDDEDVEEE